MILSGWRGELEDATRLDLATRFDQKITAYYGYLADAVGLNWRLDLPSAFYRWSGDFVPNDGLIPIQSASFAGHDVQRRGPFPNMTHTDIRDHPRVLHPSLLPPGEKEF